MVKINNKDEFDTIYKFGKTKKKIKKIYKIKEKFENSKQKDKADIKNEDLDIKLGILNIDCDNLKFYEKLKSEIKLNVIERENYDENRLKKIALKNIKSIEDIENINAKYIILIYDSNNSNDLKIADKIIDKNETAKIITINRFKQESLEDENEETEEEYKKYVKILKKIMKQSNVIELAKNNSSDNDVIDYVTKLTNIIIQSNAQIIQISLVEFIELLNVGKYIFVVNKIIETPTDNNILDTINEVMRNIGRTYLKGLLVNISINQNYSLNELENIVSIIQKMIGTKLLWTLDICEKYDKEISIQFNFITENIDKMLDPYEIIDASFDDLNEVDSKYFDKILEKAKDYETVMREVINYINGYTSCETLEEYLKLIKLV